MSEKLISRISLKQSIAVSAILKDKKTLEQIIDEEPTVDAVPVIRCKDCKWKVVTMLKENYCLRYEDIMKDDYFCADGEREEE